MRFLALRYQRLLEHDLVHDHFDVSAVDEDKQNKTESTANKYQNLTTIYCNNLLDCEVQKIDLLQLPGLIA